MRVAVLKGGRSLERNVSLRSGARVEDALHRLGHEVVPIDVGADLVDRLGEVAPDVAFVALHGRGGSEMRLNFSGVIDDDIREGERRIGKVVREQVALYSTLTGRPAEPPRETPAEPSENVVELRRRAG